MKKSQLRDIIRESIKGLINENHYNQQNPEPTSPVACECTHAFGHPKAKHVQWGAVSNNLGVNHPPGSSLQPYVTPTDNITVNGREPQVGDVVILGSATNTCSGQKLHNAAANMSQIIKVNWVSGCRGEGSMYYGAPGSTPVFTEFSLSNGTIIGGSVIDYRTIPKPLPNDPLIQKEPSKDFTTNVEPQNPNDPQIGRMQGLANIKR